MKGILAILIAGIMVAAIAVPMAIGDQASQAVTVTSTGTLDIVRADDKTTPITAINFGSGAPGAALRPATTGTNASFALNNTYNDNITISISASDFIGTDHEEHITQTAEYGLLADDDQATIDGAIDDPFPMPSVDTMDPASVKYTWVKLVLPDNAVADSYGSSNLTVTSTPT
jgi:hypothetical protein